MGCITKRCLVILEAFHQLLVRARYFYGVIVQHWARVVVGDYYSWYINHHGTKLEATLEVLLTK